MFPRSLSESPARISAIRAGRPRHRRPGRRPSDRTRARILLETLEDRRLLSGISGYTEYTIPTASSSPTGIVAGPDGNLWFIENAANKIGIVNPTSHAVTEIAIPTASSNPWGIASGPDGNIWFTERNSGKVGMVNTITRAVSELSTGSGVTGPIGITAGPDGNVWFAGVYGIGVINPTTHAVTDYPKPSGFVNAPMWITAGPDGDLWVTDMIAPHLAKFNPTTHTSTVYQLLDYYQGGNTTIRSPTISSRAPTATSGTPISRSMRSV